MNQSTRMNVKMRRSVFKRVKEYFLSSDAERGGLIGSRRRLNRIDCFVPVSGAANAEQFVPDMEAVNGIIARWRADGICFCGFVHSHPTGGGFLSQEDCRAAESWVQAAGLPFLFFGIVDGGGELHLYLARQEEGGGIVIHPVTPSGKRKMKKQGY